MRISLLLTAASALLPMVATSSAHQAATGWIYPTECCGGRDCREISQSGVREGSRGYTLPSGEVVQYGDSRIHRSPDGQYHWCTHEGRNTSGTICLFVPPSGV